MNRPTNLGTRAAPQPTLSGLAANHPIVRSESAAVEPRATVMAPAAPVQKAYPPKIAKAILHVTRNINPVAKAGFNDFHKYAYRRFEDVFEELVPLINEAGLIIQQSELTHGNVLEGMIAITYQFTIINEDGDVWPDRPEITAICKVRDSKNVLDDKAASKCNTQAQKYFYTSFFKIRSVDTSEADHDAGARPTKRTAPSPDGGFKPHEIAIREGETASQWAVRFKDMLKHAKSPEDVDAWYAANERIFNRLNSAEGYKPVVEDLIAAMDKRTLEVAPQDQQPQQQAAQATASGFPGDKPMANSADPGPIPPALRRAPPPPGAAPQIPQAWQDWLDNLDSEYAACEDAAGVASVQESVMWPGKDTAPEHVWQKAIELTSKHLNRIETDG